MSEVTTLAGATVGKRIPVPGGGRGWLTVEARLTHHAANDAPYFSLTGFVIDSRDQEVMGGMIHDTILTHFPELKPLARLHLSTDQGEPMHCYANGRYFLGLLRPGERYTWDNQLHTPDRRGFEVAADHFRIPTQEARALQSRLLAMEPDEANEELRAWIETQRPRWKAEAEEALAIIRRLKEATP